MSTPHLDRVVRCVAAATRYPSELLTANADLENDLGIDSVKLLEIIMALSDEFELPLVSQDRDASIRTIQDVAEWIEGLLHQSNQDRSTSSHHVEPQSEQIPLEESAASRQANTMAGQESGQVLHLRSPGGRNDERKERNGTKQTVGETVPCSCHSSHSSELSPHLRTEPSGSLANRIALVTGSGRGVGRTIARLLASRGATVIVNSFHSRDQGEQTATDIIQQGGKAIHLWGSVANSQHVDQIFDQIEARFGRLDMLVCNASDGRIGSFMDLTSEDWERAFRTNVVGHYQCAKRASLLMQTGGGGSIVTLSAVGSAGYIDGLGSQGVVKAAVETMTRYLACELGPFGIRVNCVVGGPVYGELLSKFSEARMTQNHWESLAADRELCSPMDLANAIGFLVSEEARGVNGSVWMVDHGFSAVADGRMSRRAMATPLG